MGMFTTGLFKALPVLLIGKWQWGRKGTDNWYIFKLFNLAFYDRSVYKTNEQINLRRWSQHIYKK